MHIRDINLDKLYVLLNAGENHDIRMAKAYLKNMGYDRKKTKQVFKEYIRYKIENVIDLRKYGNNKLRYHSYVKIGDCQCSLICTNDFIYLYIITYYKKVRNKTIIIDSKIAFHTINKVYQDAINAINDFVNEAAIDLWRH
jgi:hypothetical protein